MFAWTFAAFEIYPRVRKARRQSSLDSPTAPSSASCHHCLRSSSTASATTRSYSSRKNLQQSLALPRPTRRKTLYRCAPPRRSSTLSSRAISTRLSNPQFPCFSCVRSRSTRSRVVRHSFSTCLTTVRSFVRIFSTCLVPRATALR